MPIVVNCNGEAHAITIDLETNRVVNVSSPPIGLPGSFLHLDVGGSGDLRLSDLSTDECIVGQTADCILQCSNDAMGSWITMADNAMLMPLITSIAVALMACLLCCIGYVILRRCRADKQAPLAQEVQVTEEPSFLFVTGEPPGSWEVLESSPMSAHESVLQRGGGALFNSTVSYQDPSVMTLMVEPRAYEHHEKHNRSWTPRTPNANSRTVSTERWSDQSGQLTVQANTKGQTASAGRWVSEELVQIEPSGLCDVEMKWPCSSRHICVSLE